jgi:hypothetical protein
MGGNVIDIIIYQELLGFILSITTAIFLCASSKLNNLSVVLCCLNVASICIYAPFCILSLLGFVDFGTLGASAHKGLVSLGSFVLIMEFGAMVVISASLYILLVGNFISKLGDNCFVDSIDSIEAEMDAQADV